MTTNEAHCTGCGHEPHVGEVCGARRTEGRRPCNCDRTPEGCICWELGATCKNGQFDARCRVHGKQ